MPRNCFLDNGIDVHFDQIGQPFGALQPGQFDDLTHHCGQPPRLGVELVAKSRYRFGIVGGLQQCLGENPHRGHRGLQFMAHVGDEVAPAGLHPGLLGLVVEVDDRQTRRLVAEQPDVTAHRHAPPARRYPAWCAQFDLDLFAGVQGLLSGGPDPVVEQAVANQAQLHGAVVADHDVAQAVDNDHADRRLGDRALKCLSD